MLGVRSISAALLVSLSLASSVFAQQASPNRRPGTLVSFPKDCNGNGIDDSTDIAFGASLDCNANQVPDECDLGEVTLLEESFEAGMPADWTVTGYWHVTEGCVPLPRCDGTRFAYFGLDSSCTFDGAGWPEEMTPPPIALPAGVQSIELSYCSTYAGEGGEYDRAEVFIDGVLVDSASELFAVEDWETRTIDLTRFAGQTVSISFQFNTTDQFLNIFRGWQVDKIRLTYRLGAAGPDCNANGVLDACELDCDQNGVPDDCDLAQGAVQDCNLNGVPDACDTASATSADCNLNGVPDECDLAFSLTGTLANLESGHESITDLFENTVTLAGGHIGFCIPDLSLDEIRCISRLSTDLETDIAYTGSVAIPSPAFGPGSSHFTAMYPGLFVMAAVNCSIDRFEISGEHSPGGNTVDTLLEIVTVAGQQYAAFVRRSYGTGFTHSYNQIIIVPGNGAGISHTVSPFTDQDGQILDGLAGVDRIFYVLVSRDPNHIVGDDASTALRIGDVREITRAVIESMPLPTSLDANGNGIPDECN